VWLRRDFSCVCVSFSLLQHGWNALHWAAVLGHTAVVHVVLGDPRVGPAEKDTVRDAAGSGGAGHSVKEESSMFKTLGQ